MSSNLRPPLPLSALPKNRREGVTGEVIIPYTDIKTFFIVKGSPLVFSVKIGTSLQNNVTIDAISNFIVKVVEDTFIKKIVDGIITNELFSSKELSYKILNNRGQNNYYYTSNIRNSVLTLNTNISETVSEVFYTISTEALIDEIQANVGINGLQDCNDTCTQS